jgi:parallel beta-helix repeat protein
MFPVTISEPGSYYLTENVTASGGINIETDNVTIDLNGFTLSGGSGSGIETQGQRSGITIRNGTVRDWGQSGVAVAGAKAVLMENVVASGNGEFGIISGDQSFVTNCHADGNGVLGIGVGSDSIVSNSTANRNGVATSAGGIATGQWSVVKMCTPNGNGNTGISLSSDSTVVDCSASDNGLNGIYAFGATRIDGAVVIGNQSNGILAANGGLITNSVARDNLAAGISVGAGMTVRNCTSGGNLTGIETLDGSLVEGSTARDNSGNGIQAGHGSIVRNCTIRENQSNGILASYGVDVIGNTCSRNGSAVGGDGAGICVEGLDNRIDGNLVLSNDRGIETAMGGNTIVRNSASGNGTDYGAISTGNDVGPLGNAATATSPWANVWF